MLPRKSPIHQGMSGLFVLGVHLSQHADITMRSNNFGRSAEAAVMRSVLSWRRPSRTCSPLPSGSRSAEVLKHCLAAEYSRQAALRENFFCVYAKFKRLLQDSSSATSIAYVPHSHTRPR